MLTLPFPFNKNESIKFPSMMFPKTHAIVVECLSGSVIQARLPNHLSITAVNELMQAIEFIFFPQSPDELLTGNPSIISLPKAKAN